MSSKVRFVQASPHISNSRPYTITYGNAGAVHSTYGCPQVATSVPQTTAQQILKIESVPHPLESSQVERVEIETPTMTLNIANDVTEHHDTPQY
jgi:hypothetical protein